jgi:tetratricopeptide (TPR) repeat protein
MPEMVLKVEQIAPGEWRFIDTSGRIKTMDKMMDAVSRIDQRDFDGAEKILQSIIKKYPTHIDARHYLATTLFSRGMQKEAISFWCETMVLGMKAFPPEFVMGEDRLGWMWPENRPFLNAYAGLGIAFYQVGILEEAFVTFNSLLALNPRDEQEIRVLAMLAGFALKRPAEVLAICRLFADDPLVDTLYARPLALYQEGKKREAKRTLLLAIDKYPLVARELLKKRHARPKSTALEVIDRAGADGACHYWRKMGQYWKETDGALPFLEGCLS